MLRWMAAVAAASLICGAAAAQTPTATTPPPETSDLAPGATLKAPVRTERVCKSEPIANSRLKTKKVCVSRAEHERQRNAQKQMVRDNLERGGVQSNQSGG